MNMDIIISQKYMTQAYRHPESSATKNHRLTSWQRSSPRCVRVAQSSSWAPLGHRSATAPT